MTRRRRGVAGFGSYKSFLLRTPVIRCRLNESRQSSRIIYMRLIVAVLVYDVVVVVVVLLLDVHYSSPPPIIVTPSSVRRRSCGCHETHYTYIYYTSYNIYYYILYRYNMLYTFADYEVHTNATRRKKKIFKTCVCVCEIPFGRRGTNSVR